MDEINDIEMEIDIPPTEIIPKKLTFQEEPRICQNTNLSPKPL